MSSNPSNPSSLPAGPVRVRPFHPEDRALVLGLAPRLVLGIAPWRDPEQMLAVMRRYLVDDLEAIGPQSAVLVAEDGQGTRLGFVTVGHNVNFTGEVQAYIGELAVAKRAEGAGVGRALMDAAADWAHARVWAGRPGDGGRQRARPRVQSAPRLS